MCVCVVCERLIEKELVLPSEFYVTPGIETEICVELESYVLCLTTDQNRTKMLFTQCQ